jgi:hypothetical protein
MNRFYKPKLAKSISKPFSSNDWIFEIKWVGFRQSPNVNEAFSLKSRNLKELKYTREEIKRLTSEIMELEEDPKNIVKIKRNLQGILNAVVSCSNSNSNELELVKISAGMVSSC